LGESRLVDAELDATKIASAKLSGDTDLRAQSSLATRGSPATARVELSDDM
jgi:hypothetical protein